MKAVGRRVRLIIVLSTVGLGGSAGVCGAGEPGSFRFRGSPMPACGGFSITELGFNRCTTGGPREANPWLLTGEAGIMINVSRRHALGVTYLYTLMDGAARRGVKARLRRWLGGAQAGTHFYSSVEASLGVIMSGSHVHDTVDVPCSDGWTCPCSQSRIAAYPSLVADLDYNFADLFILAGQAEWIRLEQSESEWRVSVGLRVGSYIAPAATALLGIGIASTLSSW